MEFETGSMFAEFEADDVDGFTVIESDEEHGYRLVEQRGETWYDYWTSAEELASRVSNGECEQVALIRGAKLQTLRENAGVIDQYE